MMHVLGGFFVKQWPNLEPMYVFIDSMYKSYKCVHAHMYFRSVKVNGAMSDSQSTEFSLCGFIAVEQGHARGRVVAAAVAPAGPGSSPAAGLGRLGALACSSCLTHVLPRALG